MNLQSTIGIASLLVFISACTSLGPLAVTSNTMALTKSGKSCAYSLFGALRIIGDNDIASAVRTGGIFKVSIVDTEVTNYLVYRRDCTVVFGE